MLVAFSEGVFREQPGHNVVEPCHTRLARSTDQGDSWTLEPLEPFAATGRPVPARSPIDFGAAGLALRVVGTGYHGNDYPSGALFHSGGQGHSWKGPFALTGLEACPELSGWETTARTDAVVESPAAACCCSRPAAMAGSRIAPSVPAPATAGVRSGSSAGWHHPAIRRGP
ncbi:MAG: hypothetical protein ER33_12590 [Cyanobium sp. CACIAM 14]|nr:MAG: hypothetical protein ER33_12590 [Cyanobium sp. CACIAM 14]